MRLIRAPRHKLLMARRCVAIAYRMRDLSPKNPRRTQPALPMIRLGATVDWAYAVAYEQNFNEI